MGVGQVLGSKREKALLALSLAAAMACALGHHLVAWRGGTGLGPGLREETASPSAAAMKAMSGGSLDPICPLFCPSGDFQRRKPGVCRDADGLWQYHPLSEA